MTQAHTSFDTLLATAHDLGITVISGQLGPPIDGRMWMGNRALDIMLCPDGAERQVAILIAPGGPGGTTIRTGNRALDAAGIDRLTQNTTAAGGSLTQGCLAVLTPEMWLARHDSAPQNAGSQTTFEAATAAGWPASCGDNPVLFLDDLPIYALLAQANVGRTVTLLVGTIAAPETPQVQPIVAVSPDRAMQAQYAPITSAHRPYDRGAIPIGDARRVVQHDAWEQPRNTRTPAPEAREPAVGDRIIIRQGRRSLPALLGQIGTVIEIFRAPRDSCLVRIDGDTNRQREWFCYHDEVALYNA
jgi:hypothetical protein